MGETTVRFLNVRPRNVNGENRWDMKAYLGEGQEGCARLHPQAFIGKCRWKKNLHHPSNVRVWPAPGPAIGQFVKEASAAIGW